MDEGDRLVVGAAAGRMVIGLACDRHRAGIRTMDAAEHLDEGRLAGAVLAEQGDDFAALDAEADAFERASAAERLDDFIEAQRTRCHRWFSSRNRQPIAIGWEDLPTDDRRLAIVIYYGVIFVIDNIVPGRATLSSRAQVLSRSMTSKGTINVSGPGLATIPDVVDGA